MSCCSQQTQIQSAGAIYSVFNFFFFNLVELLIAIELQEANNIDNQLDATITVY
jgi:hypothetical protein